MRMTQTALAEKMSVPLQRVNTLINGKRAVTADTALLLSEIFDTSPEFGMNLQAQCDLYDPRRRRDANRGAHRTHREAACGSVRCRQGRRHAM